MIKHRIVMPTEQTVRIMADSMCQANVDEAWTAMRHTPFEALDMSVRMSPHVRAGVVTTGRGPAGEEVVCMYGIGETMILPDVGYPWMVVSSNWEPYARKFLRPIKHYVRQAMATHLRLENYVDARNENTLRLTEFLGFTVDPGVPLGPDGTLFCKFHWSAAKCASSPSP